MTYQKKSRQITHSYFDGKKLRTETNTYEYTLWFQGDKLVEVRNAFGFTCELNSEAWEYFNS